MEGIWQCKCHLKCKKKKKIKLKIKIAIICNDVRVSCQIYWKNISIYTDTRRYPVYLTQKNTWSHLKCFPVNTFVFNDK